MIRPLLLALTLALLIAAPAACAGPDRPRPGPEPDGRRRRRRHRAHRLRHHGGRRLLPAAARRARPATCARCSPLPGADGGLAILDRPDGTLALVRSTLRRPTRRSGHARRTYLPRLGRPRRSPGLRPPWSPTGPIASASVELTGDGQSLLTLQLDTRAANFAQAPFTGGQTRVLNLSDDPNANTYWADMTVLGDGRVLMASGDFSVARWRLFGGGDVYDPNAWATRGSVRRISNGELVTGPRGTFLFEHEPLANQRLRPFQAPFAFRSFDTRRARFRAARSAAADRSIFGTSRALQDARGRLHVVADTTSAGRWKCVLYARTGPRRSSWFGKTTVLFRTADDARAPTERPLGRGRRRARLRALARHDQRVGDAAAPGSSGKYRPRANQNDRPACTGNRYG